VRVVRFSRGSEVSFGEWGGDRVFVLDGDPFAGARRAGVSFGIDEVELLAPVEPPHLLATMGGYLPDGVDRVPPDEEPWLLPKLTPAISGADGAVILPPDVQSLWVEVELAIVIGRTVRGASTEEAREAIFGFTCVNDVTAADFLYDDVEARRPSPVFDIFRSKSVDTFVALGPCIRTDITEEDVAAGLRLTTHVNGRLAGEGNTRTQKFPVSRWVSFASAYTTLQPGDVISLGTPCPCEVSAGDVAELAVEGIGRLRSRILPAEPPTLGG
jgi:2-keto-4-pentenoate hydratase/2-oxohepta-3-ene-1,7-dioic acid hydratase in catechol pathway